MPHTGQVAGWDASRLRQLARAMRAGPEPTMHAKPPTWWPHCTTHAEDNHMNAHYVCRRLQCLYRPPPRQASRRPSAAVRRP